MRKYKILILVIPAWCMFSVVSIAQTQISNQLVTPSTITFTSPDPDTPAQSSVSATVSFTTRGGATSNTWNVQVKSDGTTFNNCTSSIPPTAVSAICSSATTLGPATAACLAPVTLSTNYQTIASGTEGPGNKNYSVVVTFIFTDSWGYVPSNTACRLAIRYRMTAN